MRFYVKSFVIRIFAPTTAAFQRTLPQDVADPFFTDGPFRKEMLLRHITRQSVSEDDLKILSELEMANNNGAKITRKGGINHISIDFLKT